jgi:hypothetical protein
MDQMNVASKPRSMDPPDAMKSFGCETFKGLKPVNDYQRKPGDLELGAVS